MHAWVIEYWEEDGWVLRGTNDLGAGLLDPVEPIVFATRAAARDAKKRYRYRGHTERARVVKYVSTNELWL